MPQEPAEDWSTVVQAMAWCHQAMSHYLNQWWPRLLMPHGVTRPQWVKHNISWRDCCNMLQINANTGGFYQNLWQDDIIHYTWEESWNGCRIWVNIMPADALAPVARASAGMISNKPVQLHTATIWGSQPTSPEMVCTMCARWKQNIVMSINLSLHLHIHYFKFVHKWNAFSDDLWLECADAIMNISVITWTVILTLVLSYT